MSQPRLLWRRLSSDLSKTAYEKEMTKGHQGRCRWVLHTKRPVS